MSGTKAGGKLAAVTNKTRYGKDFYAKIGGKGGKNGTTGGFYANRELARRAGAIGGKKSRRGKATTEQQVESAIKAATPLIQPEPDKTWWDKVKTWFHKELI